MASIDKDGGALFANNRKTNQSAPDYRGELRLNADTVNSIKEQLERGVQYPAIEIAGWKKTSNSGTVYISMAGKKPYVKEGTQPEPARSFQIRPQNQKPTFSNDIDEDSVPF
jgi:uncharacterized protein (DUF736 family)